MARDLEKEINQTLKDNPLVDRNSLYQLKFFLVNKEPTHQSRMWRCLRELKIRQGMIESINLELAELDDSKSLLDIELERLKKQDELVSNSLDKKEREIKIRQINRKKAGLAKSVIDLHKRLHEAKQEAAFLLDNFTELEKIQPLKPFDSVDVQEEYWNEKLSEELKLKMLLGRPLDTELVRIILCMRESAPIKREMINIFSQIQSKVESTKDENDKLAEQAAKAEKKSYDKWVEKDKE